jgi:uncharacterized OB-fold protein
MQLEALGFCGLGGFNGLAETVRQLRGEPGSRRDPCRRHRRVARLDQQCRARSGAMTEEKELTTVDAVPTAGRPRPAMNQDTQFFWDPAAEGRLAIQRCSACRLLRHPPGPACPSCHSLEWEVSTVNGRGTLNSYTVLHHPPAPGFDGPAIAVVVELDEGVRMISNVTGADPATLRIGEPLEVHCVPQDKGWTAPQFPRPVGLGPVR